MTLLSDVPKDADLIISTAKTPIHDIIDVHYIKKEPITRDTVQIFID